MMVQNKIKIAIMLFALLISSGIYSQEISIEGRVTTFDTIPLVKASISIKSTKSVVETDNRGMFSVLVNDGDKLTFSAKGFTPKSVKIKGDQPPLMVNLKLKPGERNVDQAINEGGHIRTSDQARFKALSEMGIDYSMYSTIKDALRVMSGVHVVGDEIRIRGNTSITPSNNEALFVVDGVIVSKMVFNSTPTSDIKSIKVLKGSEAAIYGSQGGNGVIEVVTKRGINQ